MAFDLQQPQTTAFDLMAAPFSPSAAEIDALANGLMYADVHTEGRPAGEVRGQLAPAGIDARARARRASPRSRTSAGG